MEILVFLLFVLGAIICKDIYDSTSHSVCDSPAMLKEDATIINVERKVIGSKGHKRYRTTLHFSDGFRFISHKTDVANHLIAYSISVTSELNKEIIRDALIAHAKMINKHKKASTSTVRSSPTPKADTPTPIPPKRDSPVVLPPDSTLKSSTSPSTKDAAALREMESHVYANLWSIAGKFMDSTSNSKRIMEHVDIFTALYYCLMKHLISAGLYGHIVSSFRALLVAKILPEDCDEKFLDYLEARRIHLLHALSQSDFDPSNISDLSTIFSITVTHSLNKDISAPVVPSVLDFTHFLEAVNSSAIMLAELVGQSESDIGAFPYIDSNFPSPGVIRTGESGIRAETPSDLPSAPIAKSACARSVTCCANICNDVKHKSPVFTRGEAIALCVTFFGILLFCAAIFLLQK